MNTNDKINALLAQLERLANKCAADAAGEQPGYLKGLDEGQAEAFTFAAELVRKAMA
jgi:hypothetical protein